MIVDGEFEYELNEGTATVALYILLKKMFLFNEPL